ncbi:MAG: formate dehydrogenase accessory sulfurtransferase FdhD [Chloroflexi bacterium]|nr:formate dehydrogenase accessory sulfurtransferase FdhD [Chloroflexota bacterium]
MNERPIWAPERPGATVRLPVRIVRGDRSEVRSDVVVTEEPLEIRLLAGEQRQSVAVTMRTPGNDFELAAGFLFGEGILTDRSQLASISYCVDSSLDGRQQYNIVNVRLRTTQLPPLAPLERHFFTTSACGVCGKASLEALQQRGCTVIASGQPVEDAVLRRLPEQLRAAQGLFARTGGLHAAALFTFQGELLALREDVGRHNALDKLVGWAFLAGRLPLGDTILLVSGRASYELVQKAVVVGIPVFCAISAPSSLAIAVAQTFGMTLVGFLRDDRFNVYSGEERLSCSASAASR